MIGKRTIVILLALLIGASAFAKRSEPTEILKGAIDEVIAILNDPQYDDPAHKELQLQRIWGVVEKHYDLIEMSKRALARNWTRFSPQERKTFSEVFSELLRRTYLSNIQGDYQNVTVEYIEQRMVTDTQMVVRTTVIRENVVIPVDYSLRLRDDAWKVYDLNVEGVSLIRNYRSQFDNILMKESPAQFIERLKERVRSQEEKKSDSG